MRGRKPKPTVLKDLHGSQEPRNADEPKPTTNLEGSTAPDYFDREQREAWDHALRNAPPGMLKQIDGSVLEVWVVAHCMHRKAVRLQAGRGLVIPAPISRLPIQSPYIPIINRQALIMMRAAAELGFSPTARPRVGLTFGGEDLSGSANANKPAGEESLDGYLARAPKPEAIH